MAFSLKDLGLSTKCTRLTAVAISWALDSGTTSVRAIIVDEYDCIVAQASRAISTTYPSPAGWSKIPWKSSRLRLPS